MGLAFAGLVVIWALIEGDVIADSDIRWLLPIPWVLAGTAGCWPPRWATGAAGTSGYLGDRWLPGGDAR